MKTRMMATAAILAMLIVSPGRGGDAKGPEKKPTDQPVGLAGNLGSAWWTFRSENLDSIAFTLRILQDPGKDIGYYFQLYNSVIGKNPWDEGAFYFGLQSALLKPNVGHVGKGIIFSRWGKKITPDDLMANTNMAGFTQIADYEGAFGGVRLPYEWQTGVVYTVKLAKVNDPKPGPQGTWYQVTLKPGNEGEIDCGKIRFRNNPDGSPPLLCNRACSWLEHYWPKVTAADQLTTWKASIDRVFGTYKGRGVVPATAATTYDGTKVQNTDLFFDKGNKRLLVIIGGKTLRTHKPATCPTGW